ncbi:hypothetical protein GCM10009830_48830 [Glycomyces endophyticus]|uniref:Large ribosomal subunit protein bL12 C-terminal domain-containing protein n=1 Tax=Glycomyces endophyticus TaxID=480996 RepID=A0ABN2HXJ2_9ACTN
MSDSGTALIALALILIVGAVAAVAGALRSNRNRASIAASAPLGPARPGEWSLVLDATGARQVHVVKEIRAITGLGLLEAKQLTDRTPSTVLAGVDHASASAAYRMLAAVGATVRITETGTPESAPPAEGRFNVVLDGAGPKKIQVIKEIRALTSVGLAEAKQLSERTPSTILSGVGQEAAAAAKARLSGAGAAVRIIGS